MPVLAQYIFYGKGMCIHLVFLIIPSLSFTVIGDSSNSRRITQLLMCFGISANMF